MLSIARRSGAETPMGKIAFVAASQRLIAGILLAYLFSGTAAAAPSATSCADLTKLKIAASEIALPNGGAAIMSAQMATVPADPKTPGATREFCKVLGAIA